MTVLRGASWALCYSLVAGLAGASSGALLGPALRRLFGGVLGQARVAALLGSGLVVGAGWGASVAVGAAYLCGALGYDYDRFIPEAAFCGALAGALQLGWFWLPYLLRRARGRSVWPGLLVSTLLAPGLGILGALLLPF
ncbi:MAG: hypothetical protein H6729_03015 [Deltaproteobacteria bacterium]|nr:hypothetical protein [Deltaproteobacteria bacterium]